MKTNFGVNSSSESVKPKPWVKSKTNKKEITTTVSIANSSIVTTMVTSANMETNLSKVFCFKCQGFWHFQSACPNRRVVTLREVVEVRDELFEEEERLENTFVV